MCLGNTLGPSNTRLQTALANLHAGRGTLKQIVCVHTVSDPAHGKSKRRGPRPLLFQCHLHCAKYGWSLLGRRQYTAGAMVWHHYTFKQSSCIGPGCSASDNCSGNYYLCPGCGKNTAMRAMMKTLQGYDVHRHASAKRTLPISKQLQQYQMAFIANGGSIARRQHAPDRICARGCCFARP